MRISKEFEGAVCLQDAGMQNLAVLSLQTSVHDASLALMQWQLEMCNVCFWLTCFLPASLHHSTAAVRTAVARCIMRAFLIADNTLALA